MRIQNRVSMASVKLDGFLCERCDHTWIARAQTTDKPRVCPKCKSPYWDTPRKNEIVTQQQATKEVQSYGLFPN